MTKSTTSPTTGPTPSLRRRRLAAVLKQRREVARMTADDVAAVCDVGKSTLSRLENAQIKIKPLYVRALCDAYGVDPDERDALTQLARDADQRGWWTPYGDSITAQYLEYISFENEANSILTYQPLLVPGLLQTPDYARAVIRGMVRPELAEEEVDRVTGLRLERQRWLTREDGVSLWVIVDEAVLHRPTGGVETMSAQLRHLAEMSRLPIVTLQVMPSEAGAHVGMLGSFSILEFPSPTHEDVVYVDTPVGEIFVEDDAQLQACKIAFDHLRAAALNEEESRMRVRMAAKELLDDRPRRRGLAEEQP